MTLIQPGPELQAHIRQLLKEDVDRRDQDLQHIKEWLLQQPHLPDEWDDRCLMTFLRGCKFSLERTKRKLDMYFTMRAAVPEFFADRDVSRPELQEIARLGHGPTLPGLTPKGYRVTLIRAIDPNITVANIPMALNNAIKLGLMMGDVRLFEEKTGVAGDVYIVDASVASFSKFAQINPSMIKKFVICVQEAYPVLVKEIHVVNVSPVVDAIIKFMKPMGKEKFARRVHVHSSLETLYEFVPKSVLPTEYGGTAGSIADMNADWERKLRQLRPWFQEQEQLKADESKRPGKSLNDEDLFGLDGSFRKLTID